MLNDSDIRKLCVDRHMITPFDESQLQPCSYDVTLSKSIVRYFGRGEINAMDPIISINQDRRQVDDILMNSELYHYGVKGMKWGVRKKCQASTKRMYTIHSHD